MLNISPRLLAAACCASGLITAACASSGPPALSSDLAGTSWQVQSIGGHTVTGPAPSLMFAAEDRVSGLGGCNRFFGVYEARDGYIDVRALGRTEMACDTPVMRTEQAFLDLLGEAARYRRERDRLVITAEDGRNIVLAPA